MSKIHKFSQLYDAAEDRIAWLTEDEDGSTTKLWFTQRLCRGLVKAMIPMLQKAQSAETAPQNEATVQSWEQAAAMAEFGKVAPVQPKPNAVVGVVRSINLQPSGDGFVYAFDFGGRAPLTIALRHVETRQMLAVMHRLHVAGAWPVDLFPSWIAEPDVTPASESAH